MVELPSIQFKREALKDSICAGDSLRWGISTNMWWPKMKLGLYNAQNQLLKTVYDSSLSFKPNASGKYYLKLLYDSAAQFAPAFDEAGFIDSTQIVVKSVANCAIGFSDVWKDTEQIAWHYQSNKIIFTQIHERFTLPQAQSAELQLRSIDSKIIFKTKLERKKMVYEIDKSLQKGFYVVELMYKGQSIKRKKVIVD